MPAAVARASQALIRFADGAASRDGDEGPPERRITISADAGSVAVLGEGIPGAASGDASIQIPAAVPEAAISACADALPVARGRRLRADVCSSCAAVLSMPVRRTVRSVTVTTHTGPIFTLRFDLPMQRCTDCGLDQIPHRSRRDLPRALDALFAAASDATDA